MTILGLAQADVIAVLSVLITVVFGLLTTVLAIFGWRTADRAARNDIVADLRAWANEVLDLLSEGAELCDAEAARVFAQEAEGQRLKLMTRASSLIDRGRFFFPNIHRQELEVHKSSAFIGLRPQILDIIMLSYDLLHSVTPCHADDNRKAAFEHIRRAFVSTLQMATGKSAPKSVRKYETYLNTVVCEPLPQEIRVLAHAESRNFELKFSQDLHLRRSGKSAP
jgi:hypothetical protein